MKTKGLLISSVALALAFNVSAKENVGQPGGRSGQKLQENLNTLANSCNPATGKTDLDINNVRTTIYTGGDMWWDLSNNARYEIPKGSGIHSLFAGSLWIGGIDAGGQLKVAAMTYRQTGNDFWPGPLDTTTTSTDQDVCQAFDKHFKITRKEVEDFNTWFTTGSPANYSVPLSIQNWPAHGDPSKNHANYLAPFYDANSDGVYNYQDGDFPGYDILGLSGNCKNQLFGDQTLWWVFNDKGNIHTETGAQAIGLEIQAQAFAFSTNDEINNMTFYNYKVINRSTFTLTNTYFGMWTDADLGYYNDDYVGCDVARGLGYLYNGDAVDANGSSPGPGEYGVNPPAVGIDFFQGPLADTGDGIDNDRDGATDEPGEQIIMSKFVYYNNDFSVQGNPETGTHFYNYLSGFWKDGLPFTYGGDAYNESIVCDFMFPGSSDPQGWGTGGQPQQPWSESFPSTNPPGDRRLIQSAGPFTLAPGAVNYVTVGAVWARTTQGGPTASVELVKIADDKAQALFDNCFKLLEGPDAPDLAIQELDKELILMLNNTNDIENYTEFDPLIIDTIGGAIDTTYNFEGYQIFQLKDATVSVTDVHNPDKARLVAQVDVKNGVTQLVNFEFDPTLNANVPTEEVNGEDKGIVHSFKITEDKFATGDPRLVNHKTYYYMSLSYGYNNFKTYNQNDPNALDGQKKPYKAGRGNIKVYSAIPHIPIPEAGGTEQHAAFGDGPKITRVEGQGNGGNILDITDATAAAVLADPSSRLVSMTYSNGRGPITVKVIDPLNVPNATFEFRMRDSITVNNYTDAYWVLKNTSTGDTVASDRTIAVGNEQLIPQWGISVTVEQVLDPGNVASVNNGFLEATMTFADPTKQWLTGVADADGYSAANWIRSGSVTDNSGNAALAYFDDYTFSGADPTEAYEKVLGGTWAPYKLVSASDLTNGPAGAPGWKRSFIQNALLSQLASVDIVITADKSKWTRCVVLEEADDWALAEGSTSANKVNKLDLRRHASVDKNGKTVAQGGLSDPNNPNAADYINGTGMGWFPGYAINLETGERLNMAFGENSWLGGENGKDMLWNPTSSMWSSPSFEALFGGMHYIYVFGHNGNGAVAFDVPRYDAGAALRIQLDNSVAPPSDGTKNEVYRDAMWVNMPLAAPGFAASLKSGIPPTDVKIRLRVAKPYRKCYAGQVATAPLDCSSQPVNGDMPMYTFNTADLETHKNDNESAVNALDLINVVPNPYYAYSAYETNQLDNRIKITNIPEKCTIKIFTLNGTLIRTFKKDDPKTSIDWDLKNQAGIPIASGLYIIHVDVPGVGEKILKWFGVMRPIDLDSF
jgi:hypothetical protein